MASTGIRIVHGGAPGKLDALLQSVKDTPRAWQDRVRGHRAVQGVFSGLGPVGFTGGRFSAENARFYPN
ncbi:hypothetical protein K788_0006784 [Paraburkholderia caribensis MBA4]|uniref:Uncharacterized protein n=1 Tax=Paraburkholderia caribensis MBA4 TaxID=1323664 RepID=A0A0P0R594_9BURK|nr:hypothetical protein K788_0006784 [Paraburkholderia caribensis MBA4]